MLSTSSRSLLLKFVFSEKFYGIFHLSRLQKHQNVSSNPVYHQHFYFYTVFFSKRCFIEDYLTQACLIIKTTTPQQPSLDGHNRVLYKLYLDTIRKILRCSEVGGGGGRGANKILKMGGEPIMGEGVVDKSKD